MAGWNVCAVCTPLMRLGLPAVWSDRLAPLPVLVTWPKAEVLGNPCVFVTGWPTEPGMPARGGHVDIEEARAKLTGLRRPRTP